MSGIFEKTLESIGTLLSPLGTNVALKNMLERCIYARTKRVRTCDNDLNNHIWCIKYECLVVCFYFRKKNG
jgi:hypothetical protein